MYSSPLFAAAAVFLLSSVEAQHAPHPGQGLVTPYRNATQGHGGQPNGTIPFITQTVSAYITLAPSPTEFEPHPGNNKTYTATTTSEWVTVTSCPEDQCTISNQAGAPLTVCPLPEHTTGAISTGVSPPEHTSAHGGASPEATPTHAPPEESPSPSGHGPEGEGGEQGGEHGGGEHGGAGEEGHGGAGGEGGEGGEHGGAGQEGGGEGVSQGGQPGAGEQAGGVSPGGHPGGPSPISNISLGDGVPTAAPVPIPVPQGNVSIPFTSAATLLQGSSMAIIVAFASIVYYL